MDHEKQRESRLLPVHLKQEGQFTQIKNQLLFRKEVTPLKLKVNRLVLQQFSADYSVSGQERRSLLYLHIKAFTQQPTTTIQRQGKLCRESNHQQS